MNGRTRLSHKSMKRYNCGGGQPLRKDSSPFCPASWTKSFRPLNPPQPLRRPLLHRPLLALCPLHNPNLARVYILDGIVNLDSTKHKLIEYIAACRYAASSLRWSDEGVNLATSYRPLVTVKTARRTEDARKEANHYSEGISTVNRLIITNTRSDHQPYGP